MSTETTRVLNFLASLPNGNSTVEKKILREIMLTTGGTLMARGRLYNIVSRNLGAGVYRLHLELTNP